MGRDFWSNTPYAHVGVESFLIFDNMDNNGIFLLVTKKVSWI